MSAVCQQCGGDQALCASRRCYGLVLSKTVTDLSAYCAGKALTIHDELQNLRAELARLKDHDLVVRQRMAMQEQRDNLRLENERLRWDLSRKCDSCEQSKGQALLSAVADLRRAVFDCVVALQWRPVSECELPDREQVLVQYPGQPPMMFGAAWARQYHPLAYFCAIPELKECEHPERDRHLAKESPKESSHE